MFKQPGQICRLLAIGGVMLVAFGVARLMSGSSWRTVSALDVPLDGAAVAPAPTHEGRQCRLVLSGTVHCAYDGRTYDAFYVDGATPHDRIELPALLGPAPPASASHRYEVDVAPGIAKPMLRVNVEKFVDAFLVRPSEVVSSFSGGLTAEWRERASASSAPILVGVMMLLAAGLLKTRTSRRDDDVRACLRAVRRNYRAALRALPCHPRTRADLAAKLRQLYDGAQELAARTRALRNARAGSDRATLQNEIIHLEQLSGGDAALCAERATALAEKRRTLAALDQLAHSEAHCLARLDKTAAALQSAAMKLRSMSLADAALPDDATLVSELAQELDALDEVAEELRVLDRDAVCLRHFDLAASIHLPSVSRNAR